MPGRRRPPPAIVVAASVEVHCPHCGDPQVCPDNESHLWTIEELKKATAVNDGKRECNACEELFRIVQVNRVGFLDDAPLPLVEVG